MAGILIIVKEPVRPHGAQCRRRERLALIKWRDHFRQEIRRSKAFWAKAEDFQGLPAGESLQAGYGSRAAHAGNFYGCLILVKHARAGFD